MKRIKIFLVFFFVILIALGFYYRDYIPTTRSDFEGLYYYFTDRVASTNPRPFSNSVILSDSAGGAEESQGLDPSTEFTPRSVAGQSSAQDDNSIDKNNNRIEQSDNALPQQDNSGAPQEQNNTVLPESVNNYVPFTPQAPTGNWDKFHDEACEEASLAMAHYYLNKRSLVLSKEAEKDIQYIGSKMKSGGLENLPVADVKTSAEQLYGYKNWRIAGKPTTQDIEKELSQGNIIIIPLAGREIGNPYYKTPGPLYHMLVISGYDNKKGVFITQDPGTKRGKDFTYKFNTLLKANHDFPGDENKIDQGLPKILVVVK